MESIPSFNSFLEKSVVNHWNLDALTDYKGVTLQYKDVARKIEKLHIMFENSGVQKGDKIALCGRNCANWGVAFLATLTYGAVAVPILHEFTPEQVHNIVNHSESKLLFVGDVAWADLNEKEMPNLEGIINIPDYSVLISRSEKLTYAREHLNELFGKRYPKNFRVEHIKYHHDGANELAIINYTSGTTGFSKGVMIPYRALWSNLDFAYEVLSPLKMGDNTICILPMAHMYGMAFEFIFEFCRGCHVFFLTRVPSPQIIAQAFADVKPALIIAVPLVIEKIIRKRVFPLVQNHRMKILMNMPVISKKVKEKICEQVVKAFGGNFYEIIVGGAPLNQEIESFLCSIGFPITVGYGATECAPIIAYSDWKDHVIGSCGREVVRMKVKVLSPDPENIVGEIVVKGPNVMLGYYKNEEATDSTIDKDGWYHTGDLGIIDNNGNIFIKGRCKNMLLGSSGQNIYPEEIEDKLTSMTMVNECIVVQDENKLVALIHPDYDEAHNLGFNDDDIVNIMEQNRIELNAVLPSYSHLSEIRIEKTEFEKTPKKSIKRYLYQIRH
jgi:long-chain acyl-CoA synthetase